MKVKIPAKLDSKLMIYLMILFVCLERLLESVGFPHSIIFLLDGMNAFLFMNLLQQKKYSLGKSDFIILFHVMIILISIFISIIYQVKPVLVLWGLRNYLRFYIFYEACKKFLVKEDLIHIYRLLKKLFYLHMIVFTSQYLFGYRGDYLGGIFGTATGANAYCNIFYIIICSYEVVLWFEKKEKFNIVFLIIGFSIISSALCEMKIFFVEIIMIVGIVFFIVCFIEKKYSIFLKGIFFIIIGLIVLWFGFQQMIKLYPNFADFFTIKGFLYHTTRDSGYSGVGDLNRLTAIKTINSKIFTESRWIRMIGMGLGSTEYSSSINILISNFYCKYEYLHYYWFSHAWMYLECGYVGLIGYITGFILNGFKGMKAVGRLQSNDDDAIFIITGTVLLFMTVLLYMYNQSLRLECAYLLYFSFAAIFSISENSSIHA